MLKCRKELTTDLHTVPNQLMAMSAISHHFSLFPSSGWKGWSFRKSPCASGKM